MGLVLDGGPAGLSAYLAAVVGAGEVVLSPSLRERLKAARAVADGFATGDTPVRPQYWSGQDAGTRQPAGDCRPSRSEPERSRAFTAEPGMIRNIVLLSSERNWNDGRS